MEKEIQELYEKGGDEADADHVTRESSNKTDAFLRDETNQTTKNGKGKDHKESSSEPDTSGDQDDSHVPKKRRLIWTTEMHQKFLDAIEQIGHDSKFSLIIFVSFVHILRTIKFQLSNHTCVQEPFRRK